MIKETFFKKSKGLKCLACDMRGYILPDCWYLFKNKRPKSFKAISIYIKKVLAKVEYDKNLVV